MVSIPLIDALGSISASLPATYVRRAAQANPDNLLGYSPSIALTVIAAGLYALVSIIMICLLRVGRWRARYMLSIIIASLCSSILFRNFVVL